MLDIEQGAAANVIWVGRVAARSSRCDRTEINSPAPMDSAPASSPATPLRSTTWLPTPEAAMPMTRDRLLTSPSLAPKTAARNVPASRLRPRVASPRTTSSWICSSATMAGVANDSVAYGERLSARWARARTKTEPKCRARNPGTGSGVRHAGLPA